MTLEPPPEALDLVALGALDDPRGSSEGPCPPPWAIRAAEAIEGPSAWRGATAWGEETEAVITHESRMSRSHVATAVTGDALCAA